MANRIVNSIWELIKTPWMNATDRARIDYAFFSDYQQQWRSYTTGGPNMYGIGQSPANKVTLGGPGALAVQPLLVPAVYMMETNAAIVSQVFYIANQAMKVVSIAEIHRVLGSSTPTGYVVKCTPGQTIAQGTTVMSGTFDLHATAVTQQSATLASSSATLTLAAGDRLAVVIAGTTTALAGVNVTVMLQPLVSPTLDITFSWTSNTQITSSNAAFFVANERYVVTAVRWAHTTKGSSATAAIQLTKDTTTDAPGAGTALLTNNTNAGFDGSAANNTPQVGTLTATAASLLMAIGDRLSLDFNGTLTLLAGVVCTVSLAPIAQRTELNFYLPITWAANTNRVFFIADRDYFVKYESEYHDIVAGGVSTATVTKESGTTATGSGLALLATANDLNGTARTVQSDILVTTFGYTFMRAGDRLSYKFNHAVQSSSGLAVTVTLLPA